MKTAAKPKPKTPRAKPPAQRLESAVTGVNRALDRLVRMIEREGTKFTPEQISKAFTFLARATSAGQQKAQAAAYASSLSSFSLNMDLPAGAPIVVNSVIAPVSPAWSITPSTPPPPVSGLTIGQLGGRLVKEVRDQHRPGDDRHLPASAGGDDISFLDEDEDESDTDELEND